MPLPQIQKTCLECALGVLNSTLCLWINVDSIRPAPLSSTEALETSNYESEKMSPLQFLYQILIPRSFKKISNPVNWGG